MRAPISEARRRSRQNARFMRFVQARDFFTTDALDNFIQNCQLKLSPDFVRRIALQPLKMSGYNDRLSRMLSHSAHSPVDILICNILWQAALDYHHGRAAGF